MSEPEIVPHPHRPLSAERLPWLDFTDGPPRFGDKTIPLGAHGGATQLGFNLVELPPGKQGCPFHHHLKEEEHFYVLEGRCVLRSGDERYELGPGDYVCFPAGTEVAHATLNPFAGPCRMLVVGSAAGGHPDDVCFYPDSGKVKVRALKAMLPWPQESLGYDHGEPSDVPLGETDAECQPRPDGGWGPESHG